MAVLKKTSAGILGDREFWDLSNGIKIIASSHEDSCTLFVSGASVLVLSKFLEVKHKFPHSLAETIDSQAIVVSSSDKAAAITLIEKWPN